MKWLFTTQIIYLHVQVCYPSLLVTPQHWSRVPHARFDDFLHFDYFALPTLCATFPHVRFDWLSYHLICNIISLCKAKQSKGSETEPSKALSRLEQISAEPTFLWRHHLVPCTSERSVSFEERSFALWSNFLLSEAGFCSLKQLFTLWSRVLHRNTCMWTRAVNLWTGLYACMQNWCLYIAQCTMYVVVQCALYISNRSGKIFLSLYYNIAESFNTPISKKMQYNRHVLWAAVLDKSIMSFINCSIADKYRWGITRQMQLKTCLRKLCTMANQADFFYCITHSHGNALWLLRCPHYSDITVSTLDI